MENLKSDDPNFYLELNKILNNSNVTIKDIIDQTLMMQMEVSTLSVELAAMQETLFWQNIMPLEKEIAKIEGKKEQ